MPSRLVSLPTSFLFACALLTLVICAPFAPVPYAQTRSAAQRIQWRDLGPLQAALQARGLSAAAFDSFVATTHETNVRRVREGDLDHLVFYLLQSTRFTTVPPIEPALSAKGFVEGLPVTVRGVFLRDPDAVSVSAPGAVVQRTAELLKALESPGTDARLRYFRRLVESAFPDRATRQRALLREYFRAMKFVYEKEFVAQRSDGSAAAVAELYRTRGLSTDTAVEAGYVVHLGLGVLKALEPGRRIRRVLIVGPGLDLAPRTGLVEEGPPASYQPWAVMDALVGLGLARLDDLTIVGGDINPRVVDHLVQSRREPPVLSMTSEIRDSDTVRLSPEYRDYFAQLGAAIGTVQPAPHGQADGHLRKIIRVSGPAAQALTAERLDIVTEHLRGPAYDLIIATNILPYFDDTQLALAVTNVNAMLAPAGIFLHNEGRRALGDLTAALGLSFEQSRHATIATVRGAPAPLFDSVFIHRKR